MTDEMISSTLEDTREGAMINQDKWGAIVSLMAQGVKKKAIARTLGLHIQTVRNWAAKGSWTGTGNGRWFVCRKSAIAPWFCRKRTQWGQVLR